MSPRRTLANTELPPKADSETTPTNSLVYIMRTLVDRFRKIVRHRRWIQRLGIILALLLFLLAFLAMVQQRTGPKMRPNTLPRLPEVYRMPITDTSVFRIQSGHCTRKRKLSYRYQSSIYCIHVIIASFCISLIYK